MPRELMARGDTIDFAELMAYLRLEAEEHDRGKKGKNGKPLEQKDIPYQR